MSALANIVIVVIVFVAVVVTVVVVAVIVVIVVHVVCIAVVVAVIVVVVVHVVVHVVGIDGLVADDGHTDDLYNSFNEPFNYLLQRYVVTRPNDQMMPLMK